MSDRHRDDRDEIPGITVGDDDSIGKQMLRLAKRVQQSPPQSRLCSKTQDKLQTVLAYLREVDMSRMKSVVLSWDHIQDVDEGVIVPVLELRFKED